MKIEQIKTPMFHPVTIRLETLEELDTAYRAFSRNINTSGVKEGSDEQVISRKIFTELNDIAAQYRGDPLAQHLKDL